LIINTLGFLVTAYDKYLAKIQKRRIPEKILLSLVAFGGTIGAGIAILLFRHKTEKRSYLLKFWAIAIIKIVIIYFLYPYGFREKIIV
jgi:uncharacterized membrane protein YsdA (DUF1294 family)